MARWSRPGEPGYDDARQIFNAMIDSRPALIARCATAADVIACIGSAQAHGLVVSARGGGHNVSGKAVVDGGLMIDPSRGGAGIGAERAHAWP